MSTVEELQSYSRFTTDGWNGEGSKAPSPYAIRVLTEIAHSVLSRELPEPRAMISSNGDVGLYWDLPNGYAEIAVEADDESYFFSSPKVGPEVFIEDIDSSIVSHAWFTDVLKEYSCLSIQPL